MAMTESNMLELGTQAPDFKLPDTLSGKTLALRDVKGENATVVMFLCNHCPYVLHVNPEIVRITKDYAGKGVGFVGISSNDVENYPQDSPEKMTSHAAAVGYTFPYLYDESQAVAKAYDAACTPDFYVFDADLNLVYRGRIDNSRPVRPTRPAIGELNGKDLRAALDAVLAGAEVSEIQYPSVGCNIKWKEN